MDKHLLILEHKKAMQCCMAYYHLKSRFVLPLYGLINHYDIECWLILVPNYSVAVLPMKDHLMPD